MKNGMILKNGLSTLGMLILLIFFFCQTAWSEPSKKQATQMWEAQYKNKVLELNARGGQRTTNQLHNKHYLTPVGSCWDYDVTELQKCGCRLFEKASICCRTGSSSDCEIRIGNSKLIDCSKFKQPKYGLSGDKEPPECKQHRMSAACFNRKDLTFGPGNSVGPCQSSPRFICPKKDETMQEFWANKCGPTPEDCGCTLVEECSTEEDLKCYKDWKSNKAGMDCYTNPKYKTPHDREKCYKAASGR